MTASRALRFSAVALAVTALFPVRAGARPPAGPGSARNPDVCRATPSSAVRLPDEVCDTLLGVPELSVPPGTMEGSGFTWPQGPTSNCLEIPGWSDRCEEWSTSYDGPNSHGGTSAEILTDAAASPDGRRVYVTGVTWEGQETEYDLVVVAFDAQSGARLWDRSYNNPKPLGSLRTEVGTNLAVSPDGRRVFVTGFENGQQWGGSIYYPSSDIGTLALDAETGGLVWRDSFAEGKFLAFPVDYPTGISTSPDGSSLYVSGFSIGRTSWWDAVTIAYDAATGQRRWTDRHDGGVEAGGSDAATAVLPSAEGEVVFVTGWQVAEPEPGVYRYDDLTMAYDARTGERRWVVAHDLEGAHSTAYSAALDSGAGRIYLTGGVTGQEADFLTLALDAADGSIEWSSVFSTPGNESASDLILAPGGNRLYVSGTDGAGISTVAYSASNGNELWSDRYIPEPYPAFAEQRGGLALGSDGTTLYVTGRVITQSPLSVCNPDIGCLAYYDREVGLVAYSTGSGSRAWTARYGLPGVPDLNTGQDVVVAGSRVLVAGMVGRPVDPDGNFQDFALISYKP